MKRKVVKHGTATLTVSLPSKWAKQFHINQGDEIDIIEEKERLVITTPHYIETRKMAHLNLETLGVIGGRSIGALFKAGCDVIKVNYANNDQLETIEATLPELIGFEIMHQSHDSITLQEVSSMGEEANLNSILQRTFLLMLSIAKDSISMSNEFNKELLENLIKRDVTINKFANFCRRILNKKGMAKYRELPMVYYILEEVENLGDEYKMLASFLVRKKLRIENVNIISILEEIHDIFQKFNDLYFSFSPDKARDLSLEAKILNKKIEAAFETNDVNEVRIVSYLARMLRIIVNMMGPLLTMKVPEFFFQESL